MAYSNRFFTVEFNEREISMLFLDKIGSILNEKINYMKKSQINYLLEAMEDIRELTSEGFMDPKVNALRSIKKNADITELVECAKNAIEVAKKIRDDHKKSINRGPKND